MLIYALFWIPTACHTETFRVIREMAQSVRKHPSANGISVVASLRGVGQNFSPSSNSLGDPKGGFNLVGRCLRMSLLLQQSFSD